MFSKTLLFAGLLLSALAFRVAAQTSYFHVVTNNPSAAWPYNAWANAADSLHDAVEAAQSNVPPGAVHIVLVSNGVYTISSQLVISNKIQVCGIGGADKTIVRPSGSGFRLISVTGAASAGMEVRGLTLTGADNALDGGTVHIASGAGSNWRFSNCVFSNNISSRGGAMYLAKQGTLADCSFVRNRATGTYGGAIRDDAGCKYYNCLFDGNEATTGAGGAMFLMGNATFENCTLTRNKGPGREVAGGILIWSGTISFYNSIIYDNLGNGGTNDNLHVRSTTVSFYNSCTTPIKDSSTDCTDESPLFVDPGSGYGVSRVVGEYRLSYASPCVNTGTNRAWMFTGTDLSGDRRIFQGIVDMGAYERPPSPGSTLAIR